MSLYYCYKVEGFTKNLKQCIAKVTNTPWGERVSFLFDPTTDLVAKSLHVSPFMDMLGNWSMKTNAPGDNIFVTISVRHPKLGDYFTASLTGKRISSSAADHALFFWLMPHKVALAIYWEVNALAWLWIFPSILSLLVYYLPLDNPVMLEISVNQTLMITIFIFKK
ncbi:hypothetical protein CsSME_00030093 [Camellia sinensis var. sinensis]